MLAEIKLELTSQFGNFVCQKRGVLCVRVKFREYI
jgi:hypothetical protein